GNDNGLRTEIVEVEFEFRSPIGRIEWRARASGSDAKKTDSHFRAVRQYHCYAIGGKDGRRPDEDGQPADLPATGANDCKPLPAHKTPGAPTPHSFPTRRSSDLGTITAFGRRSSK